MDKLPLVSIYKVFGIFSFKFNSKSKVFDTNSSFQYYGTILTLLMQTFNFVCFIFRQPYKSQYLVDAYNASVTAKISLYLNADLWIVLNISTMFQINIRAKKLCQLLNEEKVMNQALKSSQEIVKLNEQHRARVKLIFNVYLYSTVMISAINIYFSYGLTKLAIFTLFSQCLVFCQFFLGHHFELMIFEKLMTHYKALQFKISCDRVRAYLEMYSSCLKMSKQAIKIFQLNKYVCIVIAQVLFSFNLLVYYDMISKGSKLNYFRTLNWHLVLFVILVVCHSWNRLANEVRNFCFCCFVKILISLICYYSLLRFFNQ